MKRLILPLLVLSSLLSCKKDKSSDDDQDFPYHFTATINGAAVKYEANDLNSQYSCGTSSPYFANGDDYNIYEGTEIVDINDPLKNVIYVHLLKYFDHEPDFSEKLTMFNLGNYSYGVNNDGPATLNGASILYVDASGKEWLSEFGPQTGSTFSITEVTDNTNGTSLKIFTANFSCKLYDGSGGSIQVNNAVIRGKVFNP